MKQKTNAIRLAIAQTALVLFGCGEHNCWDTATCQTSTAGVAALPSSSGLTTATAGSAGSGSASGSAAPTATQLVPGSASVDAATIAASNESDSGKPSPPEDGDALAPSHDLPEVDAFVPSCTLGAGACINNAPQTCVEPGIWQSSAPCGGDEPVCIQATGTCGSCVDGETQCQDEHTVQTCHAGTFESTTCEQPHPACLNGACTECSPSAGTGRDCVGDTPRVCGPDGTWVVQAPCSGSTPACNATTGQCECLEGDFRCSGASLEQCSNGSWQPAETCSGDTPICDADLGRCACSSGAECREGFGLARFECVSGEWQELACSGGTSCFEGSCVECVPGSAATCQGTTRRSCSSFGTIVDETCALSCVQGACRDTRDEAGSFTCYPDSNVICTSGQMCCANTTSDTATCLAVDAACGNHDQGRFFCDDNSDCTGGQVCCFNYTMGNGTYVSCRDAASCTGQSHPVCDARHPCQGGLTCQSISSFFEIGQCK